MKRNLSIVFTALILTLFIAPIPSKALTAPVEVNGSYILPTQYLRMGVTILTSPNYGNSSGRVTSISSVMQSDKFTDVYFAFPAVSGQRYVKDANFYILDRNGAYSGAVTMKLAIYDFAGSLKHVVSASIVDLQTTASQVWTKMIISKVTDDCLLEPGEFLAFHISLDGAPSGDFDVRPVFEVSTGPLTTYLPILER